MIVTIGGPIGSGKTTAAKAIAEKFGFEYISAGLIFRKMAEERGVSVEEFSKIAEKDHGFDKELDERQVKLAKKSRDAIVDGRLSGWLIDADLKIWLKASLEARAQRVSGREGKDKEQALEDVRMRGDSELKRYAKIYKIDLCDLSPYDIVINTELFSAKGVIDIIERAISHLR